MGAFVEHQFRRGFILDEERLRKLNQLVVERTKGTAELRFRVYRGDAYSYETADINDVASEDNADWRRISRLDLMAGDSDVFRFLLTFSSDGTDLEIEGEDRDKVFVLFSDLKQYMEEEVNKQAKFPYYLTPLLGMIAFILGMFGFMVSLTSQIDRAMPSSEAVRAALETKSLEEKVNFLISLAEKREQISFVPPSIFFFGGLFLALIFWSPAPGKVMSALFPSNVFLFGAQRGRYDKRRKLASNILWGIGISFLVGVLASLAAWYLTSKR